MYDYMKALQERFDKKPPERLVRAVQSAREEVRGIFYVCISIQAHIIVVWSLCQILYKGIYCFSRWVYRTIDDLAQCFEASCTCSRSKDNRTDLLIFVYPVQFHCIICVYNYNNIVKLGAYCIQHIFLCIGKLKIAFSLVEVIIVSIVCVTSFYISVIVWGNRYFFCFLCIASINYRFHVGWKVCTLSAGTSNYNYSCVRILFCFVHQAVCVILLSRLRQCPVLLRHGNCRTVSSVVSIHLGKRLVCLISGIL